MGPQGKVAFGISICCFQVSNIQVAEFTYLVRVFNGKAHHGRNVSMLVWFKNKNFLVRATWTILFFLLVLLSCFLWSELRLEILGSVLRVFGFFQLPLVIYLTSNRPEITSFSSKLCSYQYWVEAGEIFLDNLWILFLLMVCWHWLQTLQWKKNETYYLWIWTALRKDIDV